MAGTNKSEYGTTQRAGTGYLWLWFAAGFCIVFAAMLFVGKMYTMPPSGDGVLECKLWQYYAIEIPRAWRLSSAPLGPLTSAGSSGLASVALQHVLCSLVGGGGLLGIGWTVHQIRHRRNRPK